MQSSLYRGKVYHKRHQPFEHEFAYTHISLFLNLDELEALDQNLQHFGYNRPATFSIWDKDHGPRDGSSVKAWVKDIAAARGTYPDHICMLTMPKMKGYVFNPLTIYYLYDGAGALQAALYQVHNTFGEAHCYWGEPNAKGRHETQKVFHVSPFLPLGGTYKFILIPPNEHLNFHMTLYQGDAPKLYASWEGERQFLTDEAIRDAAKSDPFHSYKVTAAIHWEALKLVLKGAIYHRRPPLPKMEIT